MLREAALDAANLEAPPRCRAARVAAVIVVARSAWEAYINEFIEVRSITETVGKLRKLSFSAKIESVYSALGYSEPLFSGETLWARLELLNRLRNRVVHNLSRPYPCGFGPEGLVTALHQMGLPEPRGKLLWEQVVLVPWTAAWSCKTSGAAIVTLETLPKNRRRSLREVQELVARALSPLEV
jgi:hypothetical protein